MDGYLEKQEVCTGQQRTACAIKQLVPEAALKGAAGS
jgi:hypothetical protein